MLHEVRGNQLIFDAPRPEWNLVALARLMAGEEATVIDPHSAAGEAFAELVDDIDSRVDQGLTPLIQPPGGILLPGEEEEEPRFLVVWGHRRTLALLYRAVRDGLPLNQLSIAVLLQEGADGVQRIATRLAENHQRSDRPLQADAEDLALAMHFLELEHFQQICSEAVNAPPPLTSAQEVRALRDSWLARALTVDPTLKPIRNSAYYLAWNNVEMVVGMSRRRRQRLSNYLSLPMSVRTLLPLSITHEHIQALLALRDLPEALEIVARQLAQQPLSAAQTRQLVEQYQPVEEWEDEEDETDEDWEETRAEDAEETQAEAAYRAPTPPSSSAKNSPPATVPTNEAGRSAEDDFQDEDEETWDEDDEDWEEDEDEEGAVEEPAEEEAWNDLDEWEGETAAGEGIEDEEALWQQEFEATVAAREPQSTRSAALPAADPAAWDEMLEDEETNEAGDEDIDLADEELTAAPPNGTGNGVQAEVLLPAATPLERMLTQWQGFLMEARNVSQIPAARREELRALGDNTLSLLEQWELIELG